VATLNYSDTNASYHCQAAIQEVQLKLQLKAVPTPLLYVPAKVKLLQKKDWVSVGNNALLAKTG
jgi:hypothetical protein